MNHKESLSELLEAARLASLGNQNRFPEKKIALLGSFTLDYLPPMLVKSFQPLKIFSTTYSADFNQWNQEILNEDSSLYAFQPDLVILITDPRDLFPSLYDVSPPGRKEQREMVEGQLTGFRSLIARLFQKLPSAELYLVIPAVDTLPYNYLSRGLEPLRGQETLEQFLQDLRALSAEFAQVTAVDWDWFTRKNGTALYQDERLWYMGRMRLNIHGCAALANLVAYYYRTRHLSPCKLIIVDLDNTLWGGVAGEEGLDCITLGHDGIGRAFRDFQKELLKLRSSGILLAICSKNDEKTAWEIFEKHPDMILKPEHFAAHRINWNDKAQNIEEMSEELSLGLESIMFLDDDPIQRASVKARLPVLVPDLPGDPSLRPNFLRGLAELHRFAMTEEDRKRSRLYQERAQRESLKAGSKSLEEFLCSLKQEACIAAMTPETLSRSAQLCQKTNQFNLTTRRYTANDLEAMLADKHVEAYTLALKDAYGDNGIVGFAILRFKDKTCEVDTLLMSCRILGRKVEQGFLSFLTERAKHRGIKILAGYYLPTEKNGQTRDFYPRFGFDTTGEPGVFCLDLEKSRVEFPRELTLAPSNVNVPEKTHARAR